MGDYPVLLIMMLLRLRRNVYTRRLRPLLNAGRLSTILSVTAFKTTTPHRAMWLFIPMKFLGLSNQPNPLYHILHEFHNVFFSRYCR